MGMLLYIVQSLTQENVLAQQAVEQVDKECLTRDVAFHGWKIALNSTAAASLRFC